MTMDKVERARAKSTRSEKFDAAIKRLTREAVKESLAEIEKAFDALIEDRDEWKQQHENLLSVRQSDLAALSPTFERAILAALPPHSDIEGLREALG